MPLSLRIDTAEARQSADAFQRILNDIKTAAATIDGLNFSKLAGQFTRLNTVIQTLNSSVNSLNVSLLILANTQGLQSLTDHFNNLKSVIRDVQAGVSSVGQGLSQATRIRVVQNSQTQNVTQNNASNVLQQATTQTSQAVNTFSQSLVTAKANKDALDKNLQQTATQTLPGFYGALRTVIALLAAFTVSNILRELKELSTELFEVGRRTEALEAVFRNATGSIDQAGRLFVIAKDRAKEYGLDVLKTAEELGKLSLAARGSSLEGEKIEEVFRGITAAEAVLIQTTGQAGGLIKVFTDILGKGRLQSEELVKQLGNRLPGSIRVVADSLGKTPQDLATAVQRGTVQVEEVLVRLGQHLLRLYGGEAALNIFRLGGAFNNLRTAIFELQLLVIKGGFSESLVGAFKALQTFLEDSRTRTAIATLGKTIVDVLGKAFEYLLGVLQFVRDNAQLTIRIFLTLTGATILIGFLGLVNAALLLGRALFAVNVAGAALSRTNLFVALAGLAVSFYAGGLVADKFSESVDGVQESIMKMQQEAERLRNTPAPINNNAPDLTRGYADALERVQKELRVLNQEFENQLTLFSVTLSGVSSLSVGYAAYEKTLSRVRALEKNETFEKFGPNAEASKAIVTRNLLNLAFGEQAIERINKNNQDLARLTQERNVIAATFQRASDQFGQVGVSELTTDIQQEYESKVIPVFNDIRQIIAQVQNTAPELAQSLAGAFNEWNKALLNNITSVRQLQGELRGLNQVTGIFRELNVNRLINRLNQPVSGTAVVRSRNPLEAGREAFNLLNPVNTIQPILRSLGPEFEKYGKEQGDRLGKLLEEYQQRNDPTKIIDSELKRVNGYLQNIEKNTDVLREKPAAGTSVGGEAFGKYADLITQSARKYGVDPELASRVINLGERSGATAISPKGAVGVAQVLPTTAQPYFPGLNLDQIREALKDPATSIDVGVRYLAEQLRIFDGNVTKAVAAYNAGPGAVQRAGGVPPYAETQAYVPRVLTGYLPTRDPATQQRNLEAVRPILDLGQRVISIFTREGYRTPRSPRLVSDFAPEGDLESVNTVRSSRENVQRISIDIEKASEPIKNIQEDLSKAIQPAQQLEIVLGSLANANLNLQNSRGDSSIVLGARAEQEIYNESIRTASQLLNTLALTQEDVKNKTDRYKDAVILTAAAFAGTYANGIERNIALSTQSINQLRDETQTLELQQRSLQINVTEREAWIAAEERRQAVLRSGIALEGESGKAIEAEIERLRKLRQATNDLNNDPINKFRESLDQLEKTGPKDLLVNSLNSITDALGNVAAAGDYSLNNLRNVFASVAQSIIAETIKLTIRLYVLKPLLESLSGGGLGSLGGGGGVSSAGEAAGTIQGFRDLGFTQGVAASSGGIVGRDSFNMRSVPSSVFAHASRFQTGGIIGTDNVPALLTPGEGIFTAEQMKRLAPAGSGSGSNYNFEVVINATDGESVRRTAPQIFGEIYARIERSAARDGSRRRN